MVFTLIRMLPLLIAGLTLLGGYAVFTSLWKSFEASSPKEAKFAKNFAKAGFKDAVNKL